MIENIKDTLKCLLCSRSLTFFLGVFFGLLSYKEYILGNDFIFSVLSFVAVILSILLVVFDLYLDSLKDKK